MLINTVGRGFYRLAHRIMRQYWRLFGGRGEGAAVALWSDGRLLVLRESYRRGLGLPAGGIDRNETPLIAALRELREEVGINLAPEQLTYRECLERQFEHRMTISHLFEADLSAPIEPTIDGREIIWADWLTPAEIRNAGHPHHPSLRRALERRQA